MTSELIVRPAGRLLVFNDEQRQMIRDTFANGASDAEFAVLMAVAESRGLNPMTRQIHFVPRFDSKKNRTVWSTQASIDGMRVIAQRSGLYDGQDEGEFELDNKGGLLLCRVRVYRKDWKRPAVGVAYWAEYVQSGPFWQNKPRIMLSKCAESIALRKAFPEDTSGLYTPEEMGSELDGGRVIEAHVEIETPRGTVHSLPAKPATTPVVDAAIDAAELDAWTKRIADTKGVKAFGELGTQVDLVTGPLRAKVLAAYAERWRVGWNASVEADDERMQKITRGAVALLPASVREAVYAAVPALRPQQPTPPDGDRPRTGEHPVADVDAVHEAVAAEGSERTAGRAWIERAPSIKPMAHLASSFACHEQEFAGDWEDCHAAYITQAGRLGYGPDGAERCLHDARKARQEKLAQPRATRVRKAKAA